MNRPKEIPQAVIDGLKKAFPETWERLLNEMKWDSFNGCYGVTRWGMYIGIELDGYVHS